MRIEKDSLGEKEIKKEAFYGVQTVRAVENFNITNIIADKSLAYAISKIKKAAALANCDRNKITKEVCDALVKSADEIIAGKFDQYIITDTIQGGAGTSFNMNINEIMANRANQLLGGELGVYDLVHPNDHANLAQSTNDVVPTAIKIALFQKLEGLQFEIKKLSDLLITKENKYHNDIKTGRTHLQDAVPIRIGQVFNAWNTMVNRDYQRIEVVKQNLLKTNMGGTAVGTAANSSLNYIKLVHKYLKQETGLDLVASDDMIDTTRNADIFLEVSSVLRLFAVNISKTASDIRLMASGPKTGFSEIILAPKQPGSSIMPAKVNPVIPEVLNQIAFKIIGNDLTVLKGVEAGQLELNVFLPVVQTALFESIKIATNGIITFRENAIKEMEFDRDRCLELLNNSACFSTALLPKFGYEESGKIVKEAFKRRITIFELLQVDYGLTSQELDLLFDPKLTTSPSFDK